MRVGTLDMIAGCGSDEPRAAFAFEGFLRPCTNA